MKQPAAVFALKAKAFLCDDAGQGLVEYALIIALIALIMIAALTFAGNKAHNSLTNSANAVGSAISY